MVRLQLPEMSEEEASELIISYLRRGDKNKHPFEDGFGFDLYLPDVIFKYFDRQQQEWLQQHPQHGTTYFQADDVTNSQPFYNAAWNLCVRGILRPGVLFHDPDRHRTFIIGAGYSLTPYGKDWLNSSDQAECLPTEYKRFSELLALHKSRYGLAYYARSQEAVKCYRAHTYLACCAMCGAAAESITLALAITKKGDEAAILKEYGSSGGRGKIERFLLANQDAHITRNFPNYTSLLNDWRDVAAHGDAPIVGEEEAFTALMLLLRFARFGEERWNTITTP